MAARPGNRPAQAPQPSTARQNEYFVPRDGIDREVITSDICRYLGNDALVRPGTYESPDGRVTQGYFITAYRNLTSAMIQDLKADSARWEQERRAASRSGGGTGGQREQNRGSSDYSTWKNRQREQEHYDAYARDNAMDVDYPPQPSAPKNPVYPPPNAYPGPPQPGPPTYPPVSYTPQAAGIPAQYPPQAYPPYPTNPPAPQYSPGPPNTGDRYPGMAAPPPMPAGGYGQVGQEASYVMGSDYRTQPNYVTSEPPRMPPHPAISSAAPVRPMYAPTNGAPGYPPAPDQYYGAPIPGSSATQAYSADPLYGRGGPTPTRQGYGHIPEPPFDNHQPPVLSQVPTSNSSTPAQMANSGPSPAPRRSPGRDSEPREREREQHRNRRPEQERDDRDRARHRQIR
ncbi:uncharacterized protein NCU01938 [Neurospora crassa OR74A]|uniref:Transcription factor RfeG n=1 Tax=Neurospora crassa (strain ATCC 24698 / 74-OR23-1A / CBS 708.71 / DSM 1257 / FGSC 987) TaxID=367110 RepID=V5IQ57_NEUCR|nr:uncharacterized protein NCU01938 [Neurospora crassa OR74A]ESA43850.1 hypothetical protein, variant [Neurospora crassa OR74A]|eukprot:XP_011392903.1 uncharacterized protein NCU01938 [Neurospora crassa OR74A]